MTEEAAGPEAFMSYSWDSRAHANWVLQLATRLVSNGVNVVLDRWDTTLGSDLAYFMEQAADPHYRVIAIVSDTYRDKADGLQGGVGYEKKVITPTLMNDLHSHRVIPVLRGNSRHRLPRFLGSAKYVNMNDDATYESAYLELLQELYGIAPTPKPPLGKNPFEVDPEGGAVALRHDPARYVSPALTDTVTFDHSNNNGYYVIGAGERTFTIKFGIAGHGSVYLLSDASDIDSVAMAPSITEASEVGDASSYDASSRFRTLKVGDAGILHNKSGYWAAIFVDEVLIRETSPDGHPSVTFRYHIPAIPGPRMDGESEAAAAEGE